MSAVIEPDEVFTHGKLPRARRVVRPLLVDEIIRFTHNARASFPAGELQRLGESIRDHGQDTPVVVRPASEGLRRDHPGVVYELVCGERRLEACRAVGLETIEAIIEELDDEEAFRRNLRENNERKNLSPMDEARAVEYALSLGFTPDAIAAMFPDENGQPKSAAWVSGTKSLLRLPGEVQALIESRELARSKGEELLALLEYGTEASKSLIDLAQRSRRTAERPLTVADLHREVAAIRERFEAKRRTVAMDFGDEEPAPPPVRPVVCASCDCGLDPADAEELKRQFSSAATGVERLALPNGTAMRIHGGHWELLCRDCDPEEAPAAPPADATCARCGTTIAGGVDRENGQQIGFVLIDARGHMLTPQGQTVCRACKSAVGTCVGCGCLREIGSPPTCEACSNRQLFPVGHDVRWPDGERRRSGTVTEHNAETGETTIEANDRFEPRSITVPTAELRTRAFLRADWREPEPTSHVGTVSPASTAAPAGGAPVPTAAEIAARRAEERTTPAQTTPERDQNDTKATPAPAKPGALKTAEEKVAEKAAAVGTPAPPPAPTRTSILISNELAARLTGIGAAPEAALTEWCDLCGTLYDYELPFRTGSSLLKRFLDACCDSETDPEKALAFITLHPEEIAGIELTEDSAGAA